jgi:hypothetical protein
MRPYLSAKFLRVGNHLINLELIQQLELRKDDSAVITIPGPRKSFRVIEVPEPAGRQLWEFFSENLVVIDFDHESLSLSKGKDRSASKKKDSAKGKAKASGNVESATEATSKRKANPKKSANKAAEA